MFDIESKNIKLGLDRIRRLMRRVENPHLEFPVIHIGGTNGKGSVAAILAAVLKEAGYKVGLYTSPHLMRFNERIKVNGQEIPDEELKSIKLKVEEIQGDIDLTVFEKLTAIAFLYFAQQKVDIVIAEVGLGGRLDATNIAKSIISIITNIGIDHTEFLGEDEISIAKEKAGIIKKNVPVIIGNVSQKIASIFKNTAKEKSALIYFIETPKGMPTGLSLKGGFQAENLALVLKTLELLEGRGYRISKKAIALGMKKVQWPGRLQIINSKPKIILDGAHNPLGAKALRESLKKMFKGRKFTLIFNALKTKDIFGIWKELMPIIDRCVFTKSSHPLSSNPWEIKEKLITVSEIESFVEEDFKNALDLAKKFSKPILITGSLFLVGDCLRLLRNPK